MKKLIEWLGMSNRWKHLIGGLIIGIFAFGWFTAMYAGVLTAGALNIKTRCMAVDGIGLTLVLQ